jgi:hypothetical protein
MADFNTVGNWDTDDSDDGKIGPNDIVLLMDDGGAFGTELSVKKSGLSTKPITVKNQTGDVPTIDGTANGVRVAAFNYITIDGITITGFTGRGIYATNTDSLIIQNCSISGGNDAAPDHGMQIAETTGAMTGIEIRNNTIGQINTAYNSNVGMTGIFVQGGSGAIVANNSIETVYIRGIALGAGSSVDGEDNIIESNTITNSYNNIIVKEGNGYIVRYNHIYDSYGNGIGINNAADNAQVYYNIVDTVDTVGSSGGNGVDINLTAVNGVFYNNAIYGGYRHALMFDGASSGWTVENNILDSTTSPEDADIGCSTARRLPIGNRDAALLYTADNNIFYAPLGYECASNMFSNDDLGTFTGTKDDGTPDNFDDWSETGATWEAVTDAEADLASLPSCVSYVAKYNFPGAPNWHSLAQTVSVTASTTYQVSYYFNSHDVSTSYTTVRIKDGSDYVQDDGTTWSGSANEINDLTTATSDTGWVQKSFVFTTDADAASLSFILVADKDVGIGYVGKFVFQEEDRYVASIGSVDGTCYNFEDYKTQSGQDAISLNTDPLFVDAVGGDFHLQVGSPAINAGTDVGLTVDYDGEAVS